MRSEQRGCPGTLLAAPGKVFRKVVEGALLVGAPLSISLVLMLTSGCLKQPNPPNQGNLSQCLQQYQPATPDPMPTTGPAEGFARSVTYAAPCEALAPAGEQRWSAVIIATDDITLRVYFIGGLLDERCDLLRKVVVVESASDVSIQLQAGADPAVRPTSACSAVGQNYVTEITLSKPLGGRTLSGPNNQGVVKHL